MKLLGNDLSNGRQWDSPRIGESPTQILAPNRVKPLIIHLKRANETMTNTRTIESFRIPWKKLNGQLNHRCLCCNSCCLNEVDVIMTISTFTAGNLKRELLRFSSLSPR